MRKMEMKEQDLLELYHLLVMYRDTYHEEEEKDLGGWIQMVSVRYRERTGGKEIREGRNPRRAGRKRSYPESHDRKILELYQEGFSIRHIAEEAGCSPGHVQDVINRQKQGTKMGCMEIN